MTPRELTWLVSRTDTDLYGIIHHPLYLVWCEKAAMDWLMASSVRIGRTEMPYEAVDIRMRFSKMAFLGDRLAVSVMRALRTADGGWKMAIRITRDHDEIVRGSFVLRQKALESEER